MSQIDWIVLGVSMAGIVLYGVWKGRGSQSMHSYFSGGKSLKWTTIGLSIMATQASAITFLSAPGQAFTEGMSFVQFYFGLPIALIVISAFFIPIYKKLNVLTAYEYLGQRFDNKTRLLGAVLFLIQRGLAAGFTIYAPALVLSSILGWNIYWTNLIIGTLVIVYTVFGGTKAVAYTHKLQMVIILAGMLLAGILVVVKLPDIVSFTDALDISGKMGRLNVVDWNFDPSSKYNVWSGLIGGFFLALSYFGTDQSQVQRYLGDQPTEQSRIGLLFNGFAKIPMQFLILLIGVLVFSFYQFNPAPIYFDETTYNQASELAEHDSLLVLDQQYQEVNEMKQSALENYLSFKAMDDIGAADASMDYALRYRDEADSLKKLSHGVINRQFPAQEKSDVNYIFLRFVLDYFPMGVIGLLLACILFASMSSTAGELNALASTTMVDVYKHNFRKEASEKHYLLMSKLFTAFWGVYAILFAFFAGELSSLIEAVNVLGSLFYGTILGIFLVGFFLKSPNGTAVFIAAAISQIVVGAIYYFELLAYLWLPLVGSGLTLLLSWIFSFDNSFKQVRE